jgi:hypothetical protein
MKYIRGLHHRLHVQYDKRRKMLAIRGRQSMTNSSIVLNGNVTSDGGLTLNQKIPLPAGPVQITIEPATALMQGTKDWWQRLQEARAVIEARGTGFRSQEDIESECEVFRTESFK